jgi:hypothetical protein
MALRFKFKKNYQGVPLHSGRIYQFAYTAYEHDPAPLIIFLYWVEGNHPSTGRQWRFIQAINLNYISRTYRKQFVDTWIRTLYTTRDVRLTWQRVKQKFPEMTFATRRYFYTPTYYIKGLRSISLDNVEKEVVGSLIKDFSTRARIGLWTRLRKLQRTYSSIMANRNRRRR